MSTDIFCYEKISLFFNAKNLTKMDYTSNTDSFIVVFSEDAKTKKITKLGNTSVVKDSQHPEFPDQLVIDYKFETIQRFILKVYDQDANAPLQDLDKHSLIGEVSFLITDLMRNKRSQSLELEFTKPHKGVVIIRGEPVSDTRDIFKVGFSGQDLKNKDWGLCCCLGLIFQSSPFVMIRRLREDGQYQLIYKNEAKPGNLNPEWDVCRIPMMNLCNGDVYRPLEIQFMDYVDNGNHTSMGEVKFNVKTLLDSGGAKSLPVIESDLVGKTVGTIFSKEYENSGMLNFKSISIERHPTFTEFIKGKMEITFMVGIDFTGSNGDFSDPTSLHYQSQLQDNAYQTAIKTIGHIIDAYDTDKNYPIYGFGAYFREKDGAMTTKVEHAYPLADGEEVHGVDGLLDAYKNAVPTVNMSGPTLFQPLIEKAILRAKSFNVTQENQKYLVLVILTDGVLNDPEATIAALQAASDLPISVIIIGVGEADFSTMNQIDGDKIKRKPGVRDLCQFVPYNKFKSEGIIELAAEVLREVPTQCLEFMASKKILPNIQKY